MVEGKEYVNVEYIKSHSISKSPQIFLNAMDEFEVDCIKIGKSLFYEKKQALVIMDIWYNKAKYLKEIINQKLSEMTD